MESSYICMYSKTINHEKQTKLLVLSVHNVANNLDPDQARQNVGPDLDPNCLAHGIPKIMFQQNWFF